jgi:DNA-directed RNA polymerase specialized sigma24 family protein
MPKHVTASDIAAMAKENPTFLAKAQVAREVVAELPSHQGEVFRRYWVPYFGPGNGYTEEEIASDLGMSVDQVHSLILQTFESIGKEWRRRKGITTGHATPQR